MSIAEDKKSSSGKSILDAEGEIGLRPGTVRAPDDSTRAEHGLKKGLNSRHIGIIAIASSIGTGLFLGSASALSNAGPLGLLLGYAVMGLLTCAIALMSAELAAFRPVAGGTTRHVYMYFDRALGITNGYLFAYTMAITAPAELVAASSLIAYWRPDLNLAIFISVFMVVIVCFNMGAVRLYGETEFFFGMLKILLILGLILAGLIVDWGGSPSGEFIGGRNWHGNGNPLKSYLVPGATGRFLAFWSTLTSAAFALGNIQVVASAASEVQNPRKNIPKALRRVFFRIIFFYLASLFVVGLILNSDDPRIGTSSGTAASPTLVGLAQDGVGPKAFLKTNRWGSPFVAVGAASLLLPLAYLNCSTQSTPIQVFNWLVNLIAVAAIVAWFIIAATYLRWYYALKKLGVDRKDLPYTCPGQPYVAYFALGFSALVTFFSGFTVFFPGNWSAASFINVFLTIGLYLVLKVSLKSPMVASEDMGILDELEVIRREKVEELEAEVAADVRMPWWRSFGDKLFG
ncbi:hypothetical protein RQP46_011137 [Phenoliferia psychrophenolica]